MPAWEINDTVIKVTEVSASSRRLSGGGQKLLEMDLASLSFQGSV